MIDGRRSSKLSTVTSIAMIESARNAVKILIGHLSGMKRTSGSWIPRMMPKTTEVEDRNTDTKRLLIHRRHGAGS